MKKKTRYSELPPGDEAVGKLERVEDFLPPPEALVFREDNTKVTIALSSHSIEFFKKQAKKHNTQYQKMIRNLLDEYVARHRHR
jgi:predicted DNA binding CopG/RHH family protein